MKLDYDIAWADGGWDEMIRYSPAPFHRRRIILKLCRSLQFSSALDVGCGNGEMLYLLSQHFQTPKLAGSDISRQILDQNRQRLPFEFSVFDASDKALDQSFDLIICSEVIEHIHEYKKALRNIRQMCNGSLILTVPSGKIFPIDKAMGHYRHFRLERLCGDLNECGFSVEKAFYWGFPFHSLYKYAINLSPETTLNKYSGQRYSAGSRLLARILTWLFYLNIRGCGGQLFILANANVAQNNSIKL